MKTLVDMKDLTDFSLENLLNFDAIFVSRMTSLTSPSFSAMALF